MDTYAGNFVKRSKFADGVEHCYFFFVEIQEQHGCILLFSVKTRSLFTSAMLHLAARLFSPEVLKLFEDSSIPTPHYSDGD